MTQIEKKKSSPITEVVIKSILSICSMLFVFKPYIYDKSILALIFAIFFSFMFPYSIFSMIQIVRSFTYSIFAALFSFMFLAFSYTAWNNLIPDAKEYGFKFAVSLTLTIIYQSFFLLYDIYRLVPKPVFIQKFTDYINSYEVIDIPEAIKNAVVKLIHYIRKNKNAGGSNDIQNTSGE